MLMVRVGSWSDCEGYIKQDYYYVQDYQLSKALSWIVPDIPQYVCLQGYYDPMDLLGYVDGLFRVHRSRTFSTRFTSR